MAAIPTIPRAAHFLFFMVLSTFAKCGNREERHYPDRPVARAGCVVFYESPNGSSLQKNGI
jgi:hypothetical protein